MQSHNSTDNQTGLAAETEAIIAKHDEDLVSFKSTDRDDRVAEVIVSFLYLWL